jgi:hypothetical protein
MPIFIKGTRYAEVAKTRQIQFSDGKILAMNRKERRAAKLYNRVLRSAEPKKAEPVQVMGQPDEKS